MSKPRWAFAALAYLLALAPTPSGAAPSSAEEGGIVVTRSIQGAWLLKDDPAQPGRNCAVRFFSARKNAAGMALIGPTSRSKSSMILLDGPDIPAPPAPKEVRIDVDQRGLATTSMRANQMPGPHSSGMLAVQVGDLRQTMASMRASESDMRVRMDGAEVLTLNYDGLNEAREAMSACLDGKRYAGKTVREATAEIRPLGASTIAGSAYYKGALLAKKQYPPKGSQAVGLIWMTDEFKAWYEQVKRDKKLPPTIPESILKHFMSTTIVDDQGGFRFTRLPPGEYMLIANYSYKENVSRQEVIGRTDVYAGNRYIGSNDHIASWSYDVMQGTSYHKTVFVRRDGDTVTVSLDKSQLICFFVCL
ncbi:carboxypeptidase-like regulatory domain-containing protein [Lysobacter silvisoli]|nr:carboxypeptidase-like regulatory domain-containing protein [Lysobacter silvisoli]